MKTLTKILVVGGLLAALGSGCDTTREGLVADCDVDISHVRVIYHQKEADKDSYTIQLNNNLFEFSANGQLRNGSITCSDGRVIYFESQEEPYIAVPVPSERQ